MKLARRYRLTVLDVLAMGGWLALVWVLVALGQGWLAS